MRRPLLLNLTLCAAVSFAAIAPAVLLAPRACAFPKPSAYPISWELKFQHGNPKRLVVNGVAYWYMTYTVMNLTDTEQLFLPVCELMTSDGSVVTADKDVPATVFQNIKQREHNKNLETSAKISGRLLIGEDQAREGVAIWKEPAPRMGTFHIFVAGLSGETVYMKDGDPLSIKDWTKVSDEEKKKLLTLRKTLDLTYQVPGDEIRPEEDVVLAKKEEWIMR
jgi:hypothetical protein